jgi:hypothetical protein
MSVGATQLALGIGVFVLTAPIAAPVFAATVVPIDWTTASTGSFASIDAAITGFAAPFLSIESHDYSGADYAAAPLSPGQEDVRYGASNDWTISLSDPVDFLFVYAQAWRGAFTTGDDPTVRYTFDRPFTILSGFTNAGVEGNDTLVLGDEQVDFHSGLLVFSGPLSSLSVVSDGLNESGQLLTFAIPEPSTALLLGSALLALAVGRRCGRG